MAVPGLEVLQSSASLRGTGSGLRKVPVVSKLIDTSTCIGCKACEVACQEWNDLPNARTTQLGNYQTLPTMTAEFWNLIKFQEAEVDGNLACAAVKIVYPKIVVIADAVSEGTTKLRIEGCGHLFDCNTRFVTV